MATHKATFGAGCFWGVESAFRKLDGVIDVAVGYSNGTTQNPTYEQVCRENTGHAEVVEIDFDPVKVTYDALLEAFWSMHDPTTLNRQGPDHGSQYRSAIFFHSPEQEQAARASMARHNESGRFKSPIVTQIEPAQTFYRGEEYHQQYLAKRGQSSCNI